MYKQSQKPFLTIGIASYNYSQYLQIAFEAIKRQRFKDFELLYADDGSTDDSVDIIDSFIRDNPDMNIRVIKGKNVGVMCNKQRLIDNANGVYLMLCDADDWMDDNCLETLVYAAKKTKADRIVSEIRNINGKSGNIMYIQHFPKHPSKWCEVLHHGAIYRLDVIRENNVHMPSFMPDDYIFITRFNTYAKLTLFLNKSIYNWRIHSESLSWRHKHASAWGGYTLINNTLSFLNDYQKEYGDKLSQKDIDELRLLLVKNYCFYLINDIALIRPMNKAWEEYCKLRDLLSKNVPCYNRLIFGRKMGISPFRWKLHVAISLLCLLETFHMLFHALMIYGSIRLIDKKRILS